MKNKITKKSHNTDLVFTKKVFVCYADPLKIYSYKNNKGINFFESDIYSDAAFIYSSDKKAYLISYASRHYNHKQKIRDYTYLPLFFSGRHLLVLDIEKNEIRTIFIHRIKKIKFNGETISLKRFLLNIGFKYRMLLRYLYNMDTSLVIRLIIQNIKIRLNK